MKRIINLIILVLLVSLPLRAQFIGRDCGFRRIDEGSSSVAPNHLPISDTGIAKDISKSELNFNIDVCQQNLDSIIGGDITPDILRQNIKDLSAMESDLEGFKAGVNKAQYENLLNSLAKIDNPDYLETTKSMLEFSNPALLDSFDNLQNTVEILLEQLPPSFEDFQAIELDSKRTEEDIVAEIYEDLNLFALADEEERANVLKNMKNKLYKCNDSAINRAVLIGLEAELSAEDISILEERGIVANITAAVAGADLTAQETLAVIRAVIDRYKNKESVPSIVVASNTTDNKVVVQVLDELASSNMNERAFGLDGLTATVYGEQIQRIIIGEVDLESLDNNEVVALQEGWNLIGESARIAITEEAAILGADSAIAVYEDSNQIELSNVNNGVELFGLLGGAPAQQAFLAEAGNNFVTVASDLDLGKVILNIANYSQDIGVAMATLVGNYNNIDSENLDVGDLDSIDALGNVSGEDYMQSQTTDKPAQPTMIDIGNPVSSILLEEDITTVFKNPTFANSLVWASFIVKNPEIESIDDLQDQELALLIEERKIPVEFLEIIRNTTKNYDISDTSYALLGNLEFFNIYSTLNIQNVISNFINFLVGDVKESTRIVNTELDVDNRIVFDTPSVIIKDILEKLNPKRTEETAKLRLAMPKKIKLGHFVMLFLSLLIFSCSLGYSAGMYHIKSRKA